MDNFDLRKYLAEGKLKEENSKIYAVILKEMDFSADGKSYDDTFALSIGEIDENENIIDEWDIALVTESKEYSEEIADVIDEVDGDYEWESNGIEEILSIHKDPKSAEEEMRSLLFVKYF